MKYSSWTAVFLVATNFVVACGDDDDGGATASGGKTGSGGAATSSGGAGASRGGAAATSGGKSSSGGAATSGGTSSIEGGAAGASGGGATAAGAGGEAAGAAGEGTAGAAGGGGLNIVQTAVAAGQFKQLTQALTSAGLVDTLEGDGPFTVFAPDDAAFAAFEAKNPGVLSQLSQAELTNVLTYHVVAGAAVKSTQLKNNQIFTTVSGSPILVGTSAGVKLTDGVKADDAAVKTADITATNGIIHVIDLVVLPPSKDIVETAVAAGTFTTLAGALTSAGLVPTLKGAGPFTVFAPTDTAFTGVTAPTGDALVNLLKFHVVSGAAGSGDLSNGAKLTTLDAATTTKLTVDLTSGVGIKDSTATAAKVAPANILAKNGVIHVVDKVLIPE